ncbi:MAG: hypothetical protein IKK91_00535 [Ruminococcus sp.]|nr:hypothetical protein [Ruminococcus sp.]
MKKLLLIEFYREGNGLFSLKQNTDPETLKDEFGSDLEIIVPQLSELPNPYELIEEFISYDPDVLCFIVNDANSSIVSSFINLTSREYPEIECIEKRINDTSVEIDDSALWNGTKAFLTGLYPNIKDMGLSAKHLYIEDLTDEVLKNVSNYIGINHNIFHTGDYSFSSKTSLETGFLHSNDTLVTKKDENLYRFDMNKGESVKDIYISDYSKYVPNNTKECYVALNTKEDFELFKSDLTDLYNTGRITKERLYIPDIVDLCRFFNCMNCSIEYMPRMRISDSKIYTCHSSDFCAGSIEEPYFKNLIKIKHSKAVEEKKRNCSECPSNLKCSRCLALPEYLKDEFCDFIRDEKDYLYLIKIVIAAKILCNCGVFKNIEDIKAVTPGNYYSVNEESAHKFSLKFDSFMFSDDNKYILFTFEKGKIYSVSKQFFELAELAARGYTVGEIADKCDIPDDSYLNVYEDGFVSTVIKLRECGIME